LENYWYLLFGNTFTRFIGAGICQYVKVLSTTLAAVLILALILVTVLFL